MQIDTDNIISVSDAIRDFSRVAQIADANGRVVIFENDHPKYLLLNMDSEEYFELSEEEKIDVVAARILKKYKMAFEELAK